MISIEVEIFEVVNGEITKLRFGDLVYSVTGIIEEISEETNTEIEINPPRPIHDELSQGELQDIRGDIIAKTHPVYIRHNVLEAFKTTETYKQGFDILKKYYPNVNDKTLTTYHRCYKNYLENGTVNQPTKRKNKKRKPKNAIGFSKTYGIWIYKDMHTKVKKAMYKWNFTPSTKEIIKETGLKQHQVHAVLSYMLEKNQIYRKFNDEINSYTYHWIH